MEFGPKRALVLASKEAGGICDTDSISSHPQNTKQVEYLTQKLADRVSKEKMIAFLPSM